MAILCTDRFNFQQIYILLKEGIYTVFCMLLTTKSDLFTVRIYSTGIATDMVCVYWKGRIETLYRIQVNIRL